MHNNTISRGKIAEWIYSSQNFEKMMETYYRQNKQNYPLEKIYENSEKTPQSSIGYKLSTDLRSINNTYFNLKESLLFSETDWIHPFMDISIHKHPRYFPPFRHHHAFFELCYILSGHCSQTVFFSNHPNIFELKDGDLIIIPPGMEHSITMNSDSATVNILLRKSTFETAFLKNLPSDTTLYSFFLNTLYDKEHNHIICHTGSDEELQNHFFNIAVEYCNDNIYSNNIINQELAIFFSKLLRNHSSSIEFSGDSSKCLELTPSILQYLELHYAHTNIQDIASHFGFNPAYLGRIFKLNTGNTLIEALVNVRLSKAKELLVTTGLSIDLISEMVGYTDTTYFIRTFKKHVEKTPYQYRKHEKQKSE